MDKKEIADIIKYSKTLKILYVEDNDTARSQITKMLENFFLDIDTAKDGKEGLDKFQKNKYDLVLSDINMPNMNGIEMLSKIRELSEQIPLIVITAHDDKDFFIKSIEINVDSYLLKPVNIEQFIKLLKKIVIKLKTQEENIRYKEEIETLNKELEKKVELKTKQLKEKLYFDDLTHVNSRYSLIENISNMKKDDCGVLLSLKIDSFGLYNDLYSNAVGNKVLVEFGKVLQKYADKNNFQVYRSHGDNFLLFKSKNSCSKNILLNYIEKLEEFLKAESSFIEDINEYIIFSATIGGAYGNTNLFANANMALTKARKGLQSHYIYDSQIDTKEYLENVLYWKSEIQKAKAEDRIEPHFQAIYDRNLNIVKYESLVRLNQIIPPNKKNIVTPNKFLEIAKITKLYNKLSYITINKTLDLAIEKNISVSINLSLQDIQNEELIDLLEKKITTFKKQKDSNSKNIILEILEDESIKDYQYVQKILSHFKEIGALVAIDDFGSGYSNLKHILELSPDYIKIDGSLIKEINEDNKSKEIVKAIVVFAKTTGIKTIAEFVADKKIFDTVFSLGIDEFQGYYLAKPISSSKL